MFVIRKDLEVPAHAARTRSEGALKATVRNLEVGEGFEFTAKGPLKQQYAKISVKNAEGKKLFKTRLWLVDKPANEAGEFTYAVKREA